MPTRISGLAHDALTEVVNISIGNAATCLSKILTQEVLLSVPKVMIISRDDAANRLPGLGSVPLVAVREHFSGQFSGCAILLFPEVNSLELVRVALPEDFNAGDIPLMRSEALSEIGNVILNGALSSIANSLRRNFLISLPELLYGDGRAILFNGEGCSPHELILFAQVDFLLKTHSIQGYILLMLDLPEFDELKKALNELIEGAVSAVSSPP